MSNSLQPHGLYPSRLLCPPLSPEVCSFVVVPLIYLCFCCMCFGYHIQKITAEINVKEIFSYFTYKYFMDSILKFKPSIRVLFCHCERWRASFIILYVIHFSSHHLLKRLYFPHWVFLVILSNISCPYIERFISRLPLLFHVSIFMPVPYSFECYSFIV